MGLPQSCNVSRTETYHVQIVFNVFKKGMCTWRKLRKKTWGTYSQFSTCLKYSPTMGNPLVHRKSPNVLLWNVSSLALTCRTLKTSADQTEPQFVSAWRGEMWKKTKWRGGPQVLEVYEVLIIVAYCWFRNMSMQVFVEGPALLSYFQVAVCFPISKSEPAKRCGRFGKTHTNCWCLKL